ncbi:MAG: FAD-dependent oxidoreductase, partial [Verrucomicrobiia bacterium]
MKTKRAMWVILPVAMLLLLQESAILASPEIRSLNRLPAGLPAMEQSARDLPVIAQADVVVAGGGLAGVSAALRAAQEGRSVILVEERNCLAHEATVAWDCALGETGPVTSGLLDTLKKGGVIKGGMLNPQKLKTVIHQTVAAQPRIRVLFFSLPAGVVMEGNRVCGLVIVNHAGRQIISGRAVVDATEQSRIAVAAGAKFDGNKRSERTVKRLATISPKPEPEIVRSVEAAGGLKNCSVTPGPQYVELVCKMPATDDIAADWSRGQAATLSMCFALRDAMTKSGVVIKEFAVSPEITMNDERR